MSVSHETNDKGKSETLPEALLPLTRYHHWVIWRKFPKKDNPDKFDKIPYQPRRPDAEARTNDPSTWGSYAEAVAAAKFADGIGFVLTDGDVAAFDLDDCRNAQTEELHPWIASLVERAGSYTEVSPSGAGLRIIGWGKGNNNRLHREFEGVIEGMGECALYRKATRFITITGKQIGDTPLADINKIMDDTLAELEQRKHKQDEEKRKHKLNGPGSPEDGGHYATQEDDDEDDLDTLIRTGGDLPVGQRSDKGVYRVCCDLLRKHTPPSAILSTLLDKANRISDHIYAQNGNVREYAIRQIERAREAVGDDIPKIRSIEIRPGQVETFKVTIGDANMVVDAEALGDFRLFNRAAIAQLRRSFEPVRMKSWNLEVDRALRVAKEPIKREEEQIRYHGTDSWKNEPKAWLVRERIPQTGAGLLSGQYSTFKSFVLLDLCGSVMTGMNFLKARTVRRGGVLIFAAEGADDIPIRAKALINHKLVNHIEQPDLLEPGDINLQELPLAYLGCCRPLLDPRTVDWMIKIAQEVQANFQNRFGLDLVLIGIDTMSASAGWESENDAAQVQIVMNHMADVSKATNTFVIAADHFGKDISAGTRGSVVKEASADVLFATLGERDEETNVVDDTRLVLRKLRSGPQGDTFPFLARLVDMGQDEYKEPLTSRVIDWNVERVEKVKPEKKTERQITMEQALAETYKAQPEKITVDGAGEVPAVRVDLLREAFEDRYLRDKPGMKGNALRQAWYDGFKRAGLTHTVIEGVGYAWWAPTPM